MPSLLAFSDLKSFLCLYLFIFKTNLIPTLFHFPRFIINWYLWFLKRGFLPTPLNISHVVLEFETLEMNIYREYFDSFENCPFLELNKKNHGGIGRNVKIISQI